MTKNSANKIWLRVLNSLEYCRDIAEASTNGSDGETYSPRALRKNQEWLKELEETLSVWKNSEVGTAVTLL